MTFSHRAMIRPAVAVSLLGLAAIVWGATLYRQYIGSPAKRRLETGMMYVQQGRGARAEAEFQEATRLEPKNEKAWELLATYYVSTNNWTAASEALKRLRQLKPQDPHIQGRLSACLLRLGDEQAAFRESQEALKRDPNDVPAMLTSAFLLSKMNEFQKEAELLKKLTQRFPEDTDFLRLLTENLSFTNNYEEARPYLDKLLQLDPTRFEAYAMRGYGWMQTDSTPEGQAKAEADFRKALQVNPYGPFPRLYLGKLYRRQNRFEQALFQLEEAARLMPDKLDVFFELGQVYARLKQPEKAAYAQKRFLELQQAKTLKDSLSKRCAVYKDDFDAHLKLGEIFLREGDFRQARFYLSHALELRPKDSGIQARMKRLATLAGELPQQPTLPEKAAAKLSADGALPKSP